MLLCAVTAACNAKVVLFYKKSDDNKPLLNQLQQKFNTGIS